MNYIASRLSATLAAFALVALASAQPLPPPISNALKRAGVPPTAASYVLIDAETGESLLSHRPNASMNPASVMKLITTAAALDLLSPSYVWRTEFLTTEAPRDGVLHAPLYLRGVGDPKITWEDLEKVFARLRAQGITDLRGGIVVDRSRFAPIAHDPSAFDNRALRPYNVAPDAALFNFKAVGFKFVPDPARGVVSVIAEPFPEGMALNANVRLIPGACGEWRRRLNAQFDDNRTSARVTFSGAYAGDCGEREWFVSVLNHDVFLEGSLRWLWKKVGCVSIGVVREGAIPSSAHVIETHVSLSITAAVNDINKFSNNVMAQHLLLTIDAEKNGSPAHLDRGAQTVVQWLNQSGIDGKGILIENGSGLSRDERITAQALAQLLRATARKPYFNDYLQSLPIAGVDGTLKSRFGASAAQNNAYLKTGSIDNVRALAGYLKLPNEKKLIYIALINHHNAAAAQDALEAGVEWAYARAQR